MRKFDYQPVLRDVLAKLPTAIHAWAGPERAHKKSPIHIRIEIECVGEGGGHALYVYVVPKLNTSAYLNFITTIVDRFDAQLSNRQWCVEEGGNSRFKWG